MSSPVNDDLDKRVMYAPPWARETPQQPPQALVAAIERLRLERLKAAQPPQDADDAERREQDNRDQHELPLERGGPIGIEAGMADTVRASWRTASLEPVTMPEPPKLRLDGPSWGMVARLSGAVACAAAVALFVSGAVPLPSIGISLKPSEGAKAASSVMEAFGVRDAGGPAQALPLVAADASAAAVSPASAPAAALASSPTISGPAPTDFRTAFASLETAAVMPAPKPLGPKIDVPAAEPATGQPKLPEVRPLDSDELAGLVKRGQALLSEGDISSARLLLRRAAEAGDAAAALTLAGTFDRAELAKLKVIGVAHDHVQAKAWYKKAAEHGSAEAVQRLQQLAQRAD
jgi:hypothetical protein